MSPKVKVTEEEFQLPPIGLLLGENKPGCEGSMKRTSNNEIGQGHPRSKSGQLM